MKSNWKISSNVLAEKIQPYNFKTVKLCFGNCVGLQAYMERFVSGKIVEAGLVCTSTGLNYPTSSTSIIMITRNAGPDAWHVQRVIGDQTAIFSFRGILSPSGIRQKSQQFSALQSRLNEFRNDPQIRDDPRSPPPLRISRWYSFGRLTCKYQ